MLERITRTELDALAAEWGFSIPGVETGEYAELTEYVLGILDQIEDVDGAKPQLPQRDPGRRPRDGEDPLNAVVRWCRVGATGEGILSGTSIVLKDSVAVAGLPMTCGSRVLADYVPERDSVVTERILAAGGEIVAITNMDDLAFSGGGDTSCYGSTLCPFDTSRTAAGSSSGSAASLWYDGIDASIGTDQGGSVRAPAAWCGVVGLKPTHGLVPYTGIAGIDQTFDHAGPMARTVEDAALLLQAVAGKDDSDPRQRDVPAKDFVRTVAEAPDDLRGVRLLLVTEALGDTTGAEPAVREAVHTIAERIRGLGAEVSEISLPEHVQGGGVAFAGFVEGMTALVTGGGNGYHWPGRYAPDLALALRDGLATRADELSPQVKLVLVVGLHLRRRYAGGVYAQAQNLRPWLRGAYGRALARADALLMPTTPGLPHTDDAELSVSARVRRGWAVLTNTYPTDMTGHPALSIPAAEASGLPVGLMLVGRHFEDDRLLEIARTVEGALGWRPDPARAVRAAVPER
jgi:amidase